MYSDYWRSQVEPILHISDMHKLHHFSLHCRVYRFLRIWMKAVCLSARVECSGVLQKVPSRWLAFYNGQCSVNQTTRQKNWKLDCDAGLSTKVSWLQSHRQILQIYGLLQTWASYYNWSLASVCLSGNYSAVSRPIGTKVCRQVRIQLEIPHPLIIL